MTRWRITVALFIVVPVVGLGQAGPEPAADTSLLSGVVRDAVTKRPVADVVVTLRSPGGGEDTAITGAGGEYAFRDLAGGEYTLSFEGPSFLPYSRTLTVAPGRSFKFNADLAPDTAQSEEIVVTGSRVPGVATETYSPVTKVSRAQLEQSGQAWVGNFLQQLPEVAGALNTQNNNGGTGTARVDLRGLGAARTLVLLNGRRVVPGGLGADATVDTLTIPAAAIERIEILKDGASAVYGSDAIAGVVNFITRQDWSGTEIAAQAGISQRGDAAQYQLSFTTGHSTEKGSIFFSGTITGQGEALQGPSRPWSQFDFSTENLGYDFGGQGVGLGYISTQGSSSIPAGRIGGATGAGNQTWADLRAAFGGATTFIRDASAPLGWRTFNGTGVTEAGGDFYNFAPENYIVTPNLRVNLFSQGTYRITGSTRAYFEGMYTHRESAQRLAPLPFFSINEGIVVSADNPYNPFGTDFTDVRKRVVEFGPRTFSQDLDTFRLLTGLRGDFIPQWRWDINFNYGRTQGVNLTQGLAQRSRMAAALGPGYIDASGVAQCGTPQAPITGCVPLDLFGGIITPEMINAIRYRGVDRGYSQQLMAAAYTSAEIGRIANAMTPLAVAAGYEHRREAGGNIPEPLTNRGDVVGNKREITEGSYYVNEVFAEANLPLLGRMGDFAAPGDLLALTAAGRLVAYNNFGTNFTYRFGGRVSPVQDVVLRANFATGFRAPPVGSLFAGVADSFPNATDPCANATTGNRPANCENPDPNIGAPSGLPDDRAQLNSRVGGNRSLRPETSTSFSAGLVLQPRWIPDLSVTVDFYNLEVQNIIQALGTGLILQRCYPTGGDAPQYCDRITRFQDGLINQIQDPLDNAGARFTNGIDLQASYSPMTPIGRLGFDLSMNFVTRFTFVTPDGTVQEGLGVADLDRADTSGASGGRNTVRGRAQVTWASGGFAAAAIVRFVSGFRECAGPPPGACLQGTRADGTPLVAAGAPSPVFRNVPAWAQADLTVSYRAEWTPQNSTVFSVGVSNLFDADPAYIVGGFNGIDPTTYDNRGRFFFANVTQTFR